MKTHRCFASVASVIKELTLLQQGRLRPIRERPHSTPACSVPISIAAAAAQNKKPIATAMSFKKRAREAECSEVASDRVSLNVGGMVFETSVTTLTGTSLYFAHHFSGVWKTMRQVFLDLDQDSFKVLLSCKARSQFEKDITLHANYVQRAVNRQPGYRSGDP